MSLQWEQVAGPFSRLTEGPAWDGQRLLFTYIPASRIMAYDPETGECSVYRDNTNHTNGLAFDADGRLYGCCSGGRAIVRFDPDGGTTTIVDSLDGQRLNTPNDLAIDRRGRIWFSNPWNEGNIDPSEQQVIMNRDILRADPQLRRQLHLPAHDLRHHRHQRAAGVARRAQPVHHSDRPFPGRSAGTAFLPHQR